MSLPPKNNDFVAISIKDSSKSYPPSSKLLCNICNCSLVLLDPQAGEWYCNRCCISYFPSKGEKVKRANKFETPGPLTDIHGNITGKKEPIVSMVGYGPNFSSRSKSTLPPSIKALKERTGVNITGFSSTVDNESL